LLSDDSITERRIGKYYLKGPVSAKGEQAQGETITSKSGGGRRGAVTSRGCPDLPFMMPKFPDVLAE
jgi:hypothetical protein